MAVEDFLLFSFYLSTSLALIVNFENGMD